MADSTLRYKFSSFSGYILNSELIEYLLIKSQYKLKETLHSNRITKRSLARDKS